MSKFKFNPNKSIDGPPAPTNGKCARWAAEAIKHFKTFTAKNDKGIHHEHIQDLISDLGHLADREDLDFEDIVRMALDHWKEER